MEILQSYLDLCTNKKGRVLQPKNWYAIGLHKDASFHFTEGSLPKQKTTNT